MPPTRRTWDALSPAYRRRLESGGVTRREYERGGSLAEARGHRYTPERLVVSRNAATPGRVLPTSAVFRRVDELPPLPGGWVEYRDGDIGRGTEYARAIGNPEYVQVYVLPDGDVITRVDRSKRR